MVQGARKKQGTFPRVPWVGCTEGQERRDEWTDRRGNTNTSEQVSRGYLPEHHRRREKAPAEATCERVGGTLSVVGGSRGLTHVQPPCPKRPDVASTAGWSGRTSSVTESSSSRIQVDRYSSRTTTSVGPSATTPTTRCTNYPSAFRIRPSNQSCERFRPRCASIHCSFVIFDEGWMRSNTVWPRSFRLTTNRR